MYGDDELGVTRSPFPEAVLPCFTFQKFHAITMDNMFHNFATAGCIGVGRGGGGQGGGGGAGPPNNLRGGGGNIPFSPPNNPPTCTGKNYSSQFYP